ESSVAWSVELSGQVLNQENGSKVISGAGAIGRFRRIYTSIALMLANSVFFVLLVNLILVPFFLIRDWKYSDNGPKTVASATHGLFNRDGSPVDNGKRSPYQLVWIDFNAYESLDPAYVGEMLDDFTGLAKLGFIYQPWVEFSEPPFKSKLVNIDLDERGI